MRTAAGRTASFIQEKNSMWRVAKSLEVLRDQVNVAHPG